MKIKFLHKNSSLEIFRIDDSEAVVLPLLQKEVFAGSGYSSFESAALDFPDQKINLNELIIKDKDCTFFAIACGDSLNNIGIYNGDILVFEMGLEPRYNDLVIAYVDGEFYGKKFRPKYNDNNQLESLKLHPENEAYDDMIITEENDSSMYGVITWSIHKHRK